MLAAYVDIKKMFDSVHHKTLWDLLQLYGIPVKTIGLLTALYFWNESVVLGEGLMQLLPCEHKNNLGLCPFLSSFNI